jgi:hypothetical protein
VRAQLAIAALLSFLHLKTCGTGRFSARWPSSAQKCTRTPSSRTKALLRSERKAFLGFSDRLVRGSQLVAQSSGLSPISPENGSRTNPLFGAGGSDLMCRWEIVVGGFGNWHVLRKDFEGRCGFMLQCSWNFALGNRLRCVCRQLRWGNALIGLRGRRRWDAWYDFGQCGSA